MDTESIYEGPRLAQPDEVANFKTGDGIEKAFYLANVLRSRHSDLSMTVDIDEKSVHLHADRDYPFESAKGLRRKILLAPNHYQAD
jgi:hypothetical protein